MPVKEFILCNYFVIGFLVYGSVTNFHFLLRGLGFKIVFVESRASKFRYCDLRPQVRKVFQLKKKNGCSQV